MGGVGKTVVCQLVAERAALSDRYEHGVFWVKLGQAAGDVEAMYGMLAVATVVAQEKVTAPDVDVAAKKLREKLLSKACLVVVDDCWDQRLVRLFVNAVNDAACSRCTMLFSTRDARIADIVEDRSCRVQVRLMDDELGRAVLRSHAMRDGQLFREPATEADKAGLALMLTVAAGLPLALGVLGAIVRKTENWAATAADLQGALDDQPDSMDKKHKSLSACFTVGYDQLAAGDPRPDLRKDRFRALCVLSKQEFVPPSTLSALWDLDPASAEAEAREMGHMAMATVREEAGRLHLGLHDLLIDWIKDKLVTGSEREIYHKKLVDGYERRLGLCRSDFGASSTVQCRPWWNLEAAGDRYIKNTLCRHLHAGGPASQRELEALLWDWRWIEWRLRDGGSPGFAYRTDCHIAGGASIQRLRKIVVGAVAVSFSMGVSAVRQVAFELSERLRVAAGTAEDCASRQLRLAAKRSLCYPSIELLRAGSLDEPREVSILAGHEMAVNCTCTLRDTRGRTILVSGSSDNTLRVWDVTRDEELAVLEGHTDYVMCVCVVDVPGAAGGGETVQRVVSGSDDETLRVWDVEEGKQLAVLEGHADDVICVCVVDVPGAAGGGGTVQRVVSGSGDKTLRVWDVKEGKQLAVLEGHADDVTCVCVVDVPGAAGGGGTVQRVVSGSHDKTLRVWDVEEGKQLAVLEGHTGWVMCVCVVDVPGAAGGGGTVQRVVSGSVDGTLRVWDVEEGKQLAVLEGHMGMVRCVCVVDMPGAAGEGGTVQRVVSGSDDKTLRVWDVEEGKQLAVLVGRTNLVTCVSVVDVPGAAGGSGTVQRVVSGSFDKTLRVWDVTRDEELAVLEGHTDDVTCVFVVNVPGAAGGGGTVQRVVSASHDKTLRVWDVEEGKQLAVLEGHTGWVMCVCVVDVPGAAGGGGTVQRVVSGSGDKTLRVWDVEEGKQLAVLEGHTGWVMCVCVVDVPGAAGGGGTVQRVVSGSVDGTLRVWDVEEGKQLAVLEGHMGMVRCVCVVDVPGAAGEGGTVQRVVSGSDDETLRVWDVEEGKQLAVLEGHTGWVMCVCVVDVPGAAGGGGTVQRVVSGSVDGTLRVWDVEEGKQLAVLEGHADDVTCVCVVDVPGAAGGGGTVQRVVSGSGDNTLRVWEISAAGGASLSSSMNLSGQPVMICRARCVTRSAVLVTTVLGALYLADCVEGLFFSLACPAPVAVAHPLGMGRLVLGAKTGAMHWARGAFEF
ncbi:hypothetical protein I4F81_008223 [Pyropia yezoensis]|uniref:Uncharacterized protein n=1 Tax=Pyropia yezoensis TaxID=2788 RepID=A0ACC3C6C2_PYRYE|nr:hypothetical protein I4F81_008223 [Neopyropia yezoensis]